MRTLARIALTLLALALLLLLLILAAHLYTAGYAEVAHAATPSVGWTVTRDGAVTVTWIGAPFNPYQEPEAYIVLGDRLTADVLSVAAVAKLEVVSASCLANVVCDVEWRGKLDAPACRAWDGVLSLGGRMFDLYGVIAGCGEAVWLPMVGR